MSENANQGDAPAPQTDPTPKQPEKKTDAVDIDALLAERLRAERLKWEADEKKKADKERAKAEEEEAKKRGEFEKLAKANEDRAAKAEAEARTLRQSIALRDHLAEKHPDYAGCAKYIAPLIPADAEGEDLAKAVSTAAEQYVKDNPRQAKPTGGAPSNQQNRQPIRTGGNAPLPQNNDRPARRFSTLTHRS